MIEALPDIKHYTVLHNILHLGKISSLPVEGAHMLLLVLLVPVLVALGVAGDGMANIPIVNNYRYEYHSHSTDP